MNRWVRDFKVVDRINLGYRPVLPFEIRQATIDSQDIKMEIPDADYKKIQFSKQVENDKRELSFGGKDLEDYKNDVNQECKSIICYKMTKTQLFNIFIRRVFKFKTREYLDNLL